MADTHGQMEGQEALLAELEGIRDIYRLDVKQFIEFVRQRKLFFVEGFKQFAHWLDEEHDGKRYSPATVNRKIAAARSRVRYAFKLSPFAGSLRRRYRLEDILKSVRLKKVDTLAVPADKVLDIEEARKLVRQTKDATIRLMVTFLVSTGVRVSEMLNLRLADLKPAKGELVQVRVMGKAARERTIYVRKTFLDRIRKYFRGQTWLFEHHGTPYSRVSVTNRIKHEALRILGREVTPQQLRHTWAAIQINRGRDINAVASVLGRSGPGSAAKKRAEADLKPEESYIDLEEPRAATRDDTRTGGGSSSAHIPRGEDTA
ncbi:MAG: tyrosine-type recombinase/integrase [Spirochaetia bacterium]